MCFVVVFRLLRCHIDKERKQLSPGRRTCTDICMSKISPLRLRNYFCNTVRNMQEFYGLPIQCIGVFRTDIKTNVDYFPTQH